MIYWRHRGRAVKDLKKVLCLIHVEKRDNQDGAAHKGRCVSANYGEALLLDDCVEGADSKVYTSKAKDNGHRQPKHSVELIDKELSRRVSR
jgi:hypothetical protein